MKTQKSQPRRFALWLPVLALLISGCSGGGKPNGCPEDISIPENVQILGANHDQKIFILRLRTAEYEMSDVVALFRTNMKTNGWTVKVDSATDENGGELQFVKGDSRLCKIFISHASGVEEDTKSINIDIKCDREVAN